MEPQSKSSKSALIVPIIVVVAVLGIIGGLAAFSPKKTASNSSATAATVVVSVSPSPSSSPASTSDTSPSSTPASTSAYKDGTYSTTGSYTSPGGNQKVGVKVTLASDVVTAVTVTNESTDGRSSEYQDQFISGIQSLVVGKKINALNVSVVSGSSLTSAGFNAAITQIEKSAKG